MLRKLGIFILAGAIMLSAPAAAFATPAKTTASVNFRSQPSLSGKIYETLPKGTNVTVLDKAGKYWVKASVDGKTGYLSTKYLAISEGKGTIIRGVNFRSQPNTKSTVYRMLKKGTVVTVLAEVDRHWLKISVDGKTGYIDKDFIAYSGTTDDAKNSSPSKVSASQIISYGERFLGTPYQFGAKYETSGKFDCSSFVQYVYGHFGIELPRVSRNQAKVGKYVPRSNLKKGDLVFFTTTTSGNQIGHVGIYAGNGKILHTYGEGGVKYSSITSGFWDKHYVTARRVL